MNMTITSKTIIGSSTFQCSPVGNKTLKRGKSKKSKAKARTKEIKEKEKMLFRRLSSNRLSNAGFDLINESIYQ